VVAVDVLAGQPEQLVVVSRFEVVPAGAFDCSHPVLLPGLYAFTVVP
jgi:hypothetical protein